MITLLCAGYGITWLFSLVVGPTWALPVAGLVTLGLVVWGFGR
jgi:hypothetical protein